MDEAQLRLTVMKKLALWPRGLAESDLAKAVRPAVLWPGLLQELAMLGLIEVHPIGDEPVARITQRGQEWIEQRNRS